MVLGPPIALILARYAMPNAGKLFGAEGSDPTQPDPDERSWYELIGTHFAVGSVTPLVYSMVLWGITPRNTGTFVQSLLAGIVRIATSIGFFSTTGRSPKLRWGLFFTLFLLPDLYFSVRSAIDRAGGRPGDANLYFIQTLPLMSVAVGLLFGLPFLAPSARKTEVFWGLWGVLLALLLGANFLIARALAKSGGVLGFLRNRPAPPEPSIGDLDPAQLYAPKPVFAAAFHDTTLWPETEPAPEQRYPSGRRALIRLWWEGDPPLQIKHDRNTVVFKVGDTERPPIVLDGPLDTAGIIAALNAAMTEDDFHAEVYAGDDPNYAIPVPQTLADPGDGAAAWTEHDVAASQFQPGREHPGRRLYIGPRAPKRAVFITRQTDPPRSGRESLSTASGIRQ